MQNNVKPAVLQEFDTWDQFRVSPKPPLIVLLALSPGSLLYHRHWYLSPPPPPPTNCMEIGAKIGGQSLLSVEVLMAFIRSV